MAMNLAGGGRAGRGGRRGRRTLAAMSEINVTPLVDVMLVLLIIFMVTAPLLATGVPVDLPQSQAKPIQTSEEPLTVSVTSDGKIYLQKTEIAFEELVPKLMAIAEGGKGFEQRIYVRGDRAVDYGTVMRVMGAINGAGFTKIALVNEPEGKKGR